MIRMKYLDLDLFDVDLALIKEHNVPDLVNESKPQEDQGDEETLSNEVDRRREEKVQMGAGNNEVVNIINEFNPISPKC